MSIRDGIAARTAFTHCQYWAWGVFKGEPPEPQNSHECDYLLAKTWRGLRKAPRTVEALASTSTLWTLLLESCFARG